MMKSHFLSVALFALLLPLSTVAQTGGDNTQNSLLPDINPQDIEIRSEFRARFPGLRRQPILGFNPKPRVFQIDPNRIPFMESREDAVAGISVSQLSRPQPPSRSILLSPPRTNLYARAGFGSFTTPEVEAYGFSRLNEQSLFSGNLNFSASDGHLDYQESGFRNFDVNGTYVNKIREDLKVTADLGVFSDYNDMFNLESDFLQNSIGKTAKKDYLGFGGNISIQKIENSLEGWKLAAGGNIFGMEMDAGTTSLSGDIDEQIYRTSFSKYWAGQRMYETFNVTGRIDGGNYQSSGEGSEQWMDAKASVEYRRLLNFSTHISGKAGVEYVSDYQSNKVFIVPEIELKHNLRDAIIITGKAYAKPEFMSIQDHQQFNRFLNYGTQIQHSYKVGARGELAFQPIQGNRIFGGVSYDYVRDYAHYQREEQAVNEYAFYNVNYANANIFELYGGITQQLVPEKFWFDARIYARRPNLKSGGDIPYEERLGLNGSLSYKPLQKLTINSWVEYTGQREDPASADNLEAFMLVSGGAEFQITEKFGAYIKVLNILGQKYEIWNGYQERPFQAFGGLTIKL